MILTTLPDLPPRPATAANVHFRRAFYERWGRENAIVCGRARHAEYATFTQTLSIKMAWGGAERFKLPRRDVVVDDDNCLVLNEGQRYASLIDAAQPAWSFAIFFRPGLAMQVAAARLQSLDAALSTPHTPGAEAGFSEHLRAHDSRLSPRLRSICAAVLDGERDEGWLEEQSLGLLDSLLDAEHQPVANSGPRLGARLELRRRLRLAADFIDSRHTEPITLADMAAAACLSRYHFVRHFCAEFGCTPYVALLKKRARSARRLMQRGQTDREQIALQAGFGNRWSMQRALARFADSA